MKKICVVTTTRAEYGILYPLIVKLLSCREWETQVVVTGAHLEQEFGDTCREIEGDGVPIYRKIPTLEQGDDGLSVSRAMANALTGFGSYFQQEQPDLAILLGDRTEQLGIAAAAMNQHIPIAHLHGGELTRGAVDDCVRHALTKMSYLHFPAAEEYRRRILQMGEEPERVFCVGALGVENILREALLSREALREEVGFPADGDYAVVTFHPVTLEEGTALRQAEELVCAMKRREDIFFLITMANADAGGRRINAYLEREAQEQPNMKLVPSLGRKRYLSAVRHAKFVLGNSSSGIIEAPVLGTPTVNIGDRQEGRLMAPSIVGCAPERDAIAEAMETAMHMERRLCQSPYGDGTSSEKIIAVLRDFFDAGKPDLKKTFYEAGGTKNEAFGGDPGPERVKGIEG